MKREGSKGIRIFPTIFNFPLSENQKLIKNRKLIKNSRRLETISNQFSLLSFTQNSLTIIQNTPIIFHLRQRCECISRQFSNFRKLQAFKKIKILKNHYLYRNRLLQFKISQSSFTCHLKQRCEECISRQFSNFRKLQTFKKIKLDKIRKSKMINFHYFYVINHDKSSQREINDQNYEQFSIFPLYH